MTLDNFLRELAAAASKFDADWRAQADAGNASYPLEMGEGDWMEQFLMFWSQEDAA